MQNFPKIVRERLDAATPAAHHPDANVLTAFAESSLPDGERGAVVEHLARCRDCRDVVALALPASEDLQKVFVPVRGWLSWPALRWGFVTVGIVAIAGVGFLQLHRRQELKQTARVEPYSRLKPSAGAAAENSDEKSPPPASSTAVSDKVSRASDENKLEAHAHIAPAPAPQPSAPALSAPIASGVAGGIGSGVVHSQFPHGPLPPAQWQQQTSRMVPSTAAKQQVVGGAINPPASSQTVEVEAAPMQLQTEATNQDLQLQAKAEQPPTAGVMGGPVAKSKPALNSVAANAAPQATDVGAQPPAPQAPALNGRNFTQLVTLAPGTTPRWTISPTGSLQRSFDQGNTWQDVDVNANAGFGQNGDYATSVQMLASPPAKEARATKKDLKSASAYLLRAVAANGPEVWVGYSKGLLLHSVDVGDHWTYVLPIAGGVNLTGDIVALEFADIQHGKVTTSTGEVWITTDDGQTWQKQ